MVVRSWYLVLVSYVHTISFESEHTSALGEKLLESPVVLRAADDHVPVLKNARYLGVTDVFIAGRQRCCMQLDGLPRGLDTHVVVDSVLRSTSFLFFSVLFALSVISIVNSAYVFVRSWILSDLFVLAFALCIVLFASAVSALMQDDANLTTSSSVRFPS